MRRSFVGGAAKPIQQGLAGFVLFACALCAGCNNTCVTGFWNPPNSSVHVTIDGENTSCSLNTATGALRLHVGNAVNASESTGKSGATGSQAVTHIYVTLAGIEAHPEAIAERDSPEWQKPAPALEKEPLQVDLLAPAGDACDAAALEVAGVRAGVYRQMRLRVLRDKPGDGAAASLTNACGDVGWNCAVFADGTRRKLEIAGEAAGLTEDSTASGSLELRIAIGNAMVVLPDGARDAAIVLDAGASALIPDRDAMRLVPAFRVVTRETCQQANLSRP